MVLLLALVRLVLMISITATNIVGRPLIRGTVILAALLVVRVAYSVETITRNDIVADVSPL